MELRHLRYFVAVAEEENVTRAAARLHVSQPPLTRQIHDLEEELGVALFSRTGNALRLTEPGRAFLEEARAVLWRVQEGVARVREAAGLCEQELHVGYAPSPTAGFLPKVIRAFRQKARNVEVTLHDMSSPEMLSGLMNGSLHAAFLVRASKRPVAGLTFVPLLAHPVRVVVPPGHPFDGRRSVTFKEVLGHPLVAYRREEYPDYHEMLDGLLGPAARRLRFVEECDSGMSLIAAVESGKGIAFSLASLKDTAGRRLRYVPLKPEPPPVEVAMAYPRKTAGELTRSFVEAVQEYKRCP